MEYKHGHKVRVIDTQCKADNIADPAILYLFLEDDEFEVLKQLMEKERNHSVILLKLIQSPVITKWHKLLINQYYKYWTDKIKIEIC